MILSKNGSVSQLANDWECRTGIQFHLQRLIMDNKQVKLLPEYVWTSLELLISLLVWMYFSCSNMYNMMQDNMIIAFAYCEPTG